MATVSPGTTHQPLTDRTAFLANKIGILLEKAAEKRLAKLGLNTRTFFVLAAIGGESPPSQKDLSRLLGIDPTQVVALIDEMQASELVVRSRNPNDRRRYDLRLTPEGYSKLIGANAMMGEIEKDFFAPLTERQLGQFRVMLQALIKDRWPAKPG